MSYDSWKTDDQHQPMFEPYGLRRTEEDDEPPPVFEQCEICGSTECRISIQGVGSFCSHAHAQLGVERHEAAMTKRSA